MFTVKKRSCRNQWALPFILGGRVDLTLEHQSLDPDPMTKHYKKAEFSINSKKNFQRVDVSNNRRRTPEQGVPRSRTRDARPALLRRNRDGSATFQVWGKAQKGAEFSLWNALLPCHLTIFFFLNRGIISIEHYWFLALHHNDLAFVYIAKGPPQ